MDFTYCFDGNERLLAGNRVAGGVAIGRDTARIEVSSATWLRVV